MKLFAAFCLFSLSLAMAQPSPSGPAHDPAAIARKALDALLGQNFADYSAVLAPQLKAATTDQQFVKFGEQIKSWGAVEKVGDPSVQNMGPSNLVTIPVSFASQEVNFMFGVNASGQVSGMVPRPVSVGWRPASYCNAASFKERNITIDSSEWKLPGTLSVPKGSGPFPAVLLVQGFGPRDRDETNSAIKVFRDLACGLASRGIVVLRYEKRTVVYAQKMAGKPYTPSDETVDDAETALDVLRAQPEVDGKHVYLLGHDLGGYLAPWIATDDEKVAGVIIMGANARPLEDVMVGTLQYMVDTQQFTSVSKADLDNAKSAAARVKKLEDTDTDAPPLLGLPSAYWIDLKGYDPIADAKKLSVPILVLAGGRDFQAPPADFTLWKNGLAGRKDATIKLYPAMNHLFVAGEGRSTEAEYKKPGHVAPEVVDDIAKFMGK
ncbi:MAG TPA: alpha/beta fold hydrolase [Bryobacteraceae bacterium]|nr:alpha/beta fold hydrolase [Bryobacteraceae bacterium]